MVQNYTFFFWYLLKVMPEVHKKSANTPVAMIILLIFAILNNAMLNNVMLNNAILK